tara:strand:+ start:2699 stop:3247 length:549 start_codon:yes stop_codon:yes gene_type:complete
MVKITNEKIEFSTTNIQTEVFPHIGSILLWGGDNLDNLTSTGYLWCNGGEHDIDDYPKLFQVIGNTYGTSGTAGKFIVPDLKRRFPLGPNSTGIIGGEGGTVQLNDNHYPHTHTLVFAELQNATRRGAESGGGSQKITDGYSLTTENFTVHPNNLDNNGNFVGPQKNYYPNYCIVNYIIRAK